MSEPRRLKMRDLEAQTGVGREAIRYYISEGLLPEPEKPKKNVAYYSQEHVLRIRAIKHLQERRYLPLSVIRTVLEHESLATAGHIPGIEQVLPELIDDTTPAPRRALEEAAETAGLAAAEVRELVELGVVDTDADGLIGFRDVAILGVWGRLRNAGFGREHGYGPESLVMYAETMRLLAREEVEQFLQRYAGRLPTRNAAELGATGVRLGNELIALLRNRAIIAALQDAADSAPGAN